MPLPLIITAPHCVTTIPDQYRDRVDLSDYEIWQFNDPFTDFTCEHPEAFTIIKGDCHRLLCDLSHGHPPVKPFRAKDFYGRTIFKTDQKFSSPERTQFLERYATPYRQSILKALEAARKAGFSKVLVVDHHNTAADHSVGQTGEYMPGITLGNAGALHTGDQIKEEPLSCPADFLHTFKKTFDQTMPFPTEINAVYTMSHTIRWLRDQVQPTFKDLKIYGLFLEYNLNFIHNPLTQKDDHQAKTMIRDGINKALGQVIKIHF